MIQPYLVSVCGKKARISLKVAFHSRKFEFKVFSDVHLNDHNF